MSNTAAHPVSQETQGLKHESPKGIGRPSTYREATAELICARLADGETLTSICKTPGMPSRQCVHQWRMRIPAFNDLYARAREIGMEAMSDDVLTIADDDSGDVNPDGTPNSANVQRSRLMVDTRKFLMGKLAPKVYGDRQTVEHTGTVEHAVTLSDRERMRRLASFLAQDAAAGVTIDGQAHALPASPALPASVEDGEATAHDEPRVRGDDV